jgi:hypothetical protein
LTSCERIKKRPTSVVTELLLLVAPLDSQFYRKDSHQLERENENILSPKRLMMKNEIDDTIIKIKKKLLDR